MKSVTRQGTKIAGVVALIAAGAVFAYTLVDAVRVEPVEAGAPLQLEVAELPAAVAAEAGRARGGSVGMDPADRAVPWREGRGGARAPAGARSETGDDAQAVREATPERSARSSPVRVRGSERAPADAEATRLAEAMQEALSFRGAATSTDELLDLAVANDPFRPDRRPGPAYVMPWERRTPAPRREEEDDDDDEPEWPELRVVGFALTQNGGAALVQHDEDMPILLAMGDRIRGYELVEVDTLSGGGATLVGPAGQIRFPVREPRIDDDDDRRRRRRRGDDDDNDRRRAQQQVQEQMQRVQEVLRRQLQQGGGNAVIRLRGGGRTPELMNLAPVPRGEWGYDTSAPAQWDWDFNWDFGEPPESEAPAVGGTRTSGPGVVGDR